MKLKFKRSARYNFKNTSIRKAFVYSIVIIHVAFTHFNLSVGLCIH